MFRVTYDLLKRRTETLNELLYKHSLHPGYLTYKLHLQTDGYEKIIYSLFFEKIEGRGLYSFYLGNTGMTARELYQYQAGMFGVLNALKDAEQFKL